MLALSSPLLGMKACKAGIEGLERLQPWQIHLEFEDKIKAVLVKVALQLSSSWATEIKEFVLLAEKFYQGFCFPPHPLAFPSLLPQVRE